MTSTVVNYSNITLFWYTFLRADTFSIKTAALSDRLFGTVLGRLTPYARFLFLWRWWRRHLPVITVWTRTWFKTIWSWWPRPRIDRRFSSGIARRTRPWLLLWRYGPILKHRKKENCVRVGYLKKFSTKSVQLARQWKYHVVFIGFCNNAKASRIKVM